MSEKIDTGGYAFPFSPTGSDSEQNGLTLLDYFAAKIMEARVAGRCAEIGNDNFNEATCAGLAKVSYKLAQAMLSEKRRIEGVK